MKNLKFNLLSLIVICGLTFSSCSSDDDSSNDQNADTYIKFTIDGTNYNFENILTAESNSITFNGNNGAGLTDPGDTQIALWLPSAITNGTFDVEDGFDAEYQVSFSSESLNFDFDFAESGTISVSQSTGEYVIGTFTATVTNDDSSTITIENGEFKAYTID
ncbi:hypothetical protein [Winogradskyella forsetii]|uniref:hypothetical protein n=1 Tax=Winogradskyella forsetii TaxID=2686077 RepID=UPI0015B97D0E|nr:hypothetical protein [Winogradskyella forsetii]